ncbi:MAG: hypothetical protein M3540_08540, partial [Actinomycetota bacterium]|nr:hypothetical protein [Actinomycetota bacterium]
TLGPDRLTGTRLADTIRGLDGNDRLDARGGHDLLVGGAGRDLMLGGTGNDRLAAQADAGRDDVRCGLGRDIANAEFADAVADDCEVVTRQLSSDPYTDFRSQHQTQVEPDSLAFGSTIVTTFQSGRHTEGGANDIGWATSTNAGDTWRTGFLPRLTVFSTPAGNRSAISDPVVAYDAAHGVWLIATLGIAGDATEIVVSRSRDGITWGAPVDVATESSEDYDKEWIVCDSWSTSRFYGRCYVSYLDFDSGEIRTRRSNDGGLTWSAPVGSPGRTRSGVANGAQPVVQPDGTLVMTYAVSAAFDFYADPNASSIDSVRSTDGGLTFSPPVRVSRLMEEYVRNMRAPSLPSSEVARDGTVYVVWSDCRLRDECRANDIVISSSPDGVRWTAARPVPIVSRSSGVHVFVPGLAVDASTSGARTRLAVAYYTLDLECVAPCGGVDAGMIQSADGGRTWGAPQRLTAETMKLDWIALTGTGRFLGDYISTSYVAGRPVPVFAVASQTVFEEFRQAIFAGTRVAAPR